MLRVLALCGCLLGCGFPLFAEEEPQPAEIIKAAAKQVQRIKTLDYSFKVSLYKKAQHVRTAGKRIRFDAVLPTKNRTGETVQAGSVYAFNGEIYQDSSIRARSMAISGKPLNHNLMSGPCWTPIEECYRWLRIAEIDFSWATVVDPATWKKLRPDTAIALEQCAGEDCVGLTFHRDNGVSYCVWFGINQDYFPLGWDLIDRSGERVVRCTVDKFQKVMHQGKPIWLPLKLTYRQVAHPPIPARELRYEILPETLKVNQPIDDRIFTLSHEGMDNVIFSDYNKVYLPATMELMPLN